MVPNKTQLLGSGRGDTGGPNTVFKACAGFPSFTAVIALCGAGPCFGVQVENLTIDCNSVTGCIGGYNAYAEEQSWFRRVAILNAAQAGLWIDYNPPYGAGGSPSYEQQNSGPYSDIEVLPGAAAVANTYCVRLGQVPAFRALAGVTCNAVGYSVIPTTAIFMDGTGGEVRDVHVEHFTNAITVGTPFAVTDLTITNIETGPENATSISLPATGSPQPQNITISSVTNSTMGGNVLVDACNGVTMAATSGLGFYATGPGTCGQQTIYTTRSDVGVKLQTALQVLKNLNVPGTATGADDGKTCVGPTLNNCLYYHESATPSVPGPVLVTDLIGLLIQNRNLGAGQTGGGMHLVGGCVTSDPACAEIGAGLTSDGGTYTARATTAAFCKFNDGNIQCYSDVGLTPGANYTPTLRFQWQTGGTFRISGTAEFDVGGAVGQTVTKVAGSCTLYFTGGILTGVTGC